jgi:hypothetical protein
MSKALLLLAWVPLLSISMPQLAKSNQVTISCDAAWELMDIVKSELRKDVVRLKC